MTLFCGLKAPRSRMPGRLGGSLALPKDPQIHLAQFTVTEDRLLSLITLGDR